MKNAMIIFGLICFSLMVLCSFDESEKGVENEMNSLLEEGEQAYYRSEYAKAFEKWEQGLELAKSSGSKKYIGQFFGSIGMVYGNMGQYEKALSYFEKALVIQRETGDRRRECSDLINIGVVHGKMGQYEKALSYFEHALSIQRETGDRRDEGKNLANIGVVYNNLGQYEKALSYYKQALAIECKNDNRRGEGTDLTNIGVVYDNLGQYEKAFSYFERALEIKREIGDRQGEAGDISSIGVSYSNMGQYEKALSYYEQALAIAREIGDRQGESRYLSNVAGMHSKMGQDEKALSYFERTLAIKREIGDRQGEGTDLTNIGRLYSNLDQYEKSLSYYEQALTIAREIGDRRGEGRDLAGIGIFYSNMDQYEKALSYFEQALAIAREIGDRRGEERYLTGIGKLYSILGQYEKAFSYFEQALTIAREIDVRQEEAGDLTGIGMLYSNLGLYEKALSYYEQALAIAREIDARQEEAADLTGIGTLYSNLGQYERSLSYYEQALAIAREIGDRQGEAADLTNIGAVYRNLCQYENALSYCEQALAYCEQALAIAREIGARHGVGNNLTNIGILHSDTGRYEKARKSFNESLKICMEVDAPEWLWKTRLGLAGVEAKLENVDDSISHYEQALDTIETMREGITEKETKTSFIENKLFVYDELIELLQNLHQKQPDREYDRKSLEIFERKQGRIFLEEMGKAGARNFAGILDAVLTKENNLVGKLTKLQSDRIKEGSKPEKDRDMKRIRELERKIEGVKADQQKLQETIKTEYPDYYALKYPKPAALKDIQKHVLKPREMMMVYWVMEKQTCLWVISKDQLELYTIQIKEKELSDKVNNFRKAPDRLSKAIKLGLPDFRIEKLAKKFRKNLHQNAYELYELLVPEKAKPIISKAEILYIIPTSSLYGLPFEALVTQIDGQDIHYLVEDHPIAYLSSASLLKIIRESQARKKEKATQPLLAFANPVYGSKRNPVTRVISATDTTSFNEIRLRGYLDLIGGNLSELPQTEDEVNEIKTILKASDDSLQLRENASRSNVIRMNKQGRLDDYRYVIFSCHGLLPGEINQLMQPALALSHPDPETGKQGFLTMADVFGIRLNADLVTLSACNTGRGTLQKGEGVRGLTRAFMYAGTPAASVTLWSVESVSAKILSTGLYKNLEAGMNRAEALREIKLQMIRGEKGEIFKHPFFWAPVVIFGDGGTF